MILFVGFYIIFLVYKELIMKELLINRKMVIGVWVGLLGFVLMIFGILILNNVIVDLCYIFIIMVGFYGGFILVIVLVVIIIILWFLILVNFVVMMVGVIMMLIGIIIVFFSKCLEKYNIWGVFILNIIVCGFVVVNLYLILVKELDFWINMFIFVLIVFVIGVVFVGLMKNMIKLK